MAQPRLITLESDKTYATRANAIKAVEKAFAGHEDGDILLYFVNQDEKGRFFPVFVGERAIRNMVHFRFNVVA